MIPHHSVRQDSGLDQPGLSAMASQALHDATLLRPPHPAAAGRNGSSHEWQIGRLATSTLAHTGIYPKCGDPSCFGRLLHVASLAKLQAGRDDGPALDGQRLREIRVKHIEAFEEWLSLSIREKKADIEVWAADQECSAAWLLALWIRPPHQQELVPASALPPQRELFAMELEVLFLIVGG